MVKSKKRNLTDLQAEEDISQSQTEELKYGGVGHEDQSDKHTSSLSENEDHNDNEGDEAATKNESCDDESEYQDDSDIESDKDAEEDTDEEDDEEVDEIQVDFEAFEPEAKDWPAVRSLLKQLLLRAEVDVGDLSDIVITQAKETSIVMKQIEDADDDDEEDEDEIVTKKLSKKSTSKSLGKGNDSAIQVTPSGSSSSLNAGNHLQSAEDTQNLDVFSVTSLLNLNDGSVRSRRGVQQLLQMLRQTAESNRLANAAASDALLKVLDDQSGNRVGLCLNERFINLPYRVGFESLQHVLAESERKHIKFTHFVMISKLLRPKLSERKKKGARKSADKSTTETPFKKPKLIDTNDENSIRLNPEDDLFVELADAIIEYETDTDFVDCTVNVNWESGTDFLPFRQILLFNSRSFKNAIKRLKQNLEDFSETIQ